MGNYENIVKIEEMRKKLDEGDYQSAQKILDTLDLKKIKNSVDMTLLAEVFTQNERYNEAMDMLLKIYQKVKTRKIVYQLVQCSIKRNNTFDAERYLFDYKKIAPKDFYNYIFRYKIDKLKGVSFPELIETLEILKKTEYIEQWAYELAKLYYKAGMEEECINECTDIILWFGDGVYVEKAKLLRAYYSGEADKDKLMEELKRRATKEEETCQPELNQDQEEKYLEEIEQEDSAYDLENVLEEVAEEEIFKKEITEDEVSEEELSEDEVSNDEVSNDEVSEDEIFEDEKFQDEKFQDEKFQEEIPEDEILEEEIPEDFTDDLIKDIENILMEDQGASAYSVEVSDELSKEIESSEEANFPENEAELTSNGSDREDSLQDYREGYEVILNDNGNEEEVTSEYELAEREVEASLYQMLQEEEMDEEDKKIKEMSKELGLSMEEVFGNFLHVKAVKKQLVKSLEDILRERTKSIQMIITGTEKSGKTTLAKDLTIFFNKTGKLKSTKVAKISADKMNGIDVLSKKGTLRYCCLIIENASELNRNTIESLLELIQYFHGDIIVIFEENKKNINKLFRECPKLMDLFKNRIHLPQYTPEDLLGFAHACLKQQDYRLSTKAHPILQSKIYQIAKHSEAKDQLERIQELIKALITATDVRVGKQLPDLAQKGRLKEVDLMYILPEDFNPIP